MAISNNVVHLSVSTPNTDSSFENSFQQLLIKFILPTLDEALLDIQNYLSSRCDSATNNSDLSLFNENYALFQKTMQNIKDKYIDELMINTHLAEDSPKDNNTLSLMKNEELDKKLINQIAAQTLIIDEGTQLLINLKNRLPENCNHFFLLTPENLCTSFSKALSSLPLTVELEEKLLLILSRHIREPALAMWAEADQLLESKGYDILSAPVSRSPSHNQQPAVPKPLMANNNNLIETLTQGILEKVENQLSGISLLAPERPQTIKSIDLAGTLSTIQLQLLEKLNSIEDVASSIKDALEHRGINQKLSKRHQDLISLVGMLFEFILDHHDLNNEVRKLISLLQIPVLKLALFDQKFLNHRHHPARDLLNEMTTAGMKCSEDAPPDDPVILLIEETVRKIIAESEDNPEIFNESLIKFRIDVTACLESVKEEKEARNNHLNKTPETIIDPPTEETSTDHSVDDSTGEDDEIEEIILESESSPGNLFSGSHSQGRSSFQPIPNLHIGDWVEFIGISEKRLRCQLDSIDEHHNRYIFTNRSGMKVTEKNGNSLKKEINKGTAKIIDHTPLFDKALQTVMSKFLNF
ncbi:DUF1631 domain-containing protein [Endozoicomonas sp. Mp262]|uniref:DUF1631 domain-containing protein n=1 Tax=Endozoicomonas sp. Mp262 TaxID=2919499 RepID=UPI0021D87392